MAAAVMPLVGMAHLSAQMKTDAYTECRGVGRIARNDRPADRPGQAKSADAPVVAQGNFPC